MKWHRMMIVTAFWILAGNCLADVAWTDGMTGTKFLLLSSSQTWAEAEKACSKKGYDLFNFEYLSEEEKNRFIASPIVDGIQWVKYFANEPTEREESSLWMSSEMGVILRGARARSVTVLSVSRFPDGARTRRVNWIPDRNERRNAVCMYQSRQWEGCEHEMTCTFENLDGGQSILRYSFYEYGPHRGIALARIRERIQSRLGAIGARCEPSISDPVCISYR